MAAYKFEATDAAGREISDVIEAPSEDQARATIREWGCFITEISPASHDEALAAIRELGEACCDIKKRVAHQNGAAQTRVSGRTSKRASLAQTFRDYLLVAAVLGAMLFAAVSGGMQLESALYGSPLLALALVGFQYWWRWRLGIARWRIHSERRVGGRTDQS
jgi:hypothetical protein